MRIAVATCSIMAPEFTDDQLVVRELESRGAQVTYESWDADLDWPGFDVVAVRSPWDYTLRHDEFTTWASAVGPNLHNSAALMLWNADKAYVADLDAAGLEVIETTYLSPGDEWPGDGREVVIKPTVSAGGRDTGRFRPELEEDARALIDAIHSQGKTAMVQPFQRSVDAVGETALVFIDGRFSHPLRKRSVLRPDEVAPVRTTDLMAAEVMYEPDLVVAGTYEPDELELAERVIAFISERFDYVPLYARVDMLRGESGEPMLLELEAVEPNLYFNEEPDAVRRLVDGIINRVGDG